MKRFIFGALLIISIITLASCTMPCTDSHVTHNFSKEVEYDQITKEDKTIDAVNHMKLHRCEECNLTEEIGPEPHDFGDPEVSTETINGIEMDVSIYTCKKCGYSYKEYAHDHVYGDEYTNHNSTHHWKEHKCTKCSLIEETTDRKPHDFGDPEVSTSTEPVTMSDGKKYVKTTYTYKCKDCDFTYSSVSYTPYHVHEYKFKEVKWIDGKLYAVCECCDNVDSKCYDITSSIEILSTNINGVAVPYTIEVVYDGNTYRFTIRVSCNDDGTILIIDYTDEEVLRYLLTTTIKNNLKTTGIGLIIYRQYGVVTSSEPLKIPQN